MSTEIFIKILYALGIGILIGLERSIHTNKERDDLKNKKYSEVSISKSASPDSVRRYSLDDLIGVRTYTVLSLIGLIAALLAANMPVVAPVLIGGAIILVIVMYWRTPELDPGITTEAAAIATCGLGALVYVNHQAAIAIALLITVLLASKGISKKAVSKIRWVEMIDTLKFLFLILIVLPLLPDKALDSYQVFNPYKVTLLVILISGIGFVGYFLTKFFGASRGLALTGLLGGLTSSTAVTASMASRTKLQAIYLKPCALATIIANVTMFVRVLVIASILDMALMNKLLLSIGTMGTVAALAAIILWLKSRKIESSQQQDGQELTLKNPFSLGPAIKFSVFFVVIIFVARIAQIYLGDQGLYLAALLSGLADVDAISMSIAEQAHSLQIMRTVAATAITIAVVSNSVVKSLIAFYSGGWRFGILIASTLIGATGTGLIILYVWG